MSIHMPMHMSMHIFVHRHTKDAAVERSSITVILNKGEGCTVKDATRKKPKMVAKIKAAKIQVAASDRTSSDGAG